MRRVWKLSLALLIAGFAGHAAAQDARVTVQGNLVTSFCYLANDTSGADHKECAMNCSNAGAPAGVVTNEGEFVLVSAYVSKIVDYMESEVRVTGEMRHGVLVLSRFEVRDGEGWTEIDAGPKLPELGA